MSAKMYTPSCKVAAEDRKWFLIDAEGLVLGRLASKIADLLRGKEKASFTPHNDCGDYVVVINAEKIFLTGKKMDHKNYYWHTGYPGGIKHRSARQILEGRFPERVIEKAVKGMIPDGPLGRQVMKKLRIYAGSTHPHDAQSLEKIDFASLNSKNRKRS